MREMKLQNIKQSEKLLSLRAVDPVTVSRYRLAMRAGAKFPPMLIERDSKVLVCGNHRYEACKAEYGEDCRVKVHEKWLPAERDMLIAAAQDNAEHGRPLDGWTKQRFAIALESLGEDREKIAKLLNIPVGHLEKWGERRVVVIGKNNRRTVQPIKRGVVVPSGEMTQEQYQEHERNDVGMKLNSLLRQVIEHLENGWYDKEDEETDALLTKLRSVLR